MALSTPNWLKTIHNYTKQNKVNATGKKNKVFWYFKELKNNLRSLSETWQMIP